MKQPNPVCDQCANLFQSHTKALAELKRRRDTAARPGKNEGKDRTASSHTTSATTKKIPEFHLNLPRTAIISSTHLRLEASNAWTLESSIPSASQARCAMCRIIYFVARRYRGNGKKPPTAALSEFRIDAEDLQIKRFLVIFTHEDEYPQCFELLLRQSVDIQPIRLDPSLILDSDLLRSWLSSCLRHCVDTHTKCKQDIDHGWLPTRLIDVGFGASSPRQKLILSTTLSSPDARRAPYITLSHKWGKGKFTVLSSANLLQFQDNIPAECLPKTFLDAIDFTRKVGVRYLWIDSLCIMQDSVEDWQREAPTMYAVYSNCLLNIAASNSNSPQEGLASRWSPILHSPVPIVFDSAEYKAEYSCSYDPWDDINGLTPLNQRGWVLQERLLSPRTIHFASTVFWECRESRVSLIQPDGFSGVTEKIWPRVAIGKEHHYILRLWDELLETYSKCSLTKSQDKFIAISGIARILQPLIGGDYLAGLWKGYFIRGMMWTAAQDKEGYSTGETHAIHDRAPSWSWASLDGPLNFSHQSKFPSIIAEVLDAQTTPLDGDPFGQIRDGFAKLLGKLYELGIFNTVWDAIWKDGAPFYVGLDDYTEASRVHGRDAVFLLPLAHDPLTSFGDANTPRYFCLLLQRAGIRGSQGAYRRIGFVILGEYGGIPHTHFECPKWTYPPWDPYDMSEILLV